MVVAFWLTTRLLRQWHGIASRSRTASLPWRLRRFSSLPRNRLIRLGNCDGRGLLAHDAAAPSVARACFALPGGFAVTMWMSVCLAAASSIPSYILAAWKSRGSMKKAWVTSVCTAFQSRHLEISYLLRHFKVVFLRFLISYDIRRAQLQFAPLVHFVFEISHLATTSELFLGLAPE